MKRNPNPQGKGLIPILSVLAEGRSAAAHVPPKRIDQVSVELFTSMFVLESDFKFQPLPGKPYWLYRKRGRFWLSLVEPDGRDGGGFGKFIGRCELQRDMTWTLELSPEAAADGWLQKWIEEKRRRFEDSLDAAETVADALPGYNESAPFYQRAYTYALAHSLRASMQKSGIASLPYERAKGLLPASSSAGD